MAFPPAPRTRAPVRSWVGRDSEKVQSERRYARTAIGAIGGGSASSGRYSLRFLAAGGAIRAALLKTTPAAIARFSGRRAPGPVESSGRKRRRARWRAARSGAPQAPHLRHDRER